MIFRPQSHRQWTSGSGPTAQIHSVWKTVLKKSFSNFLQKISDPFLDPRCDNHSFVTICEFPKKNHGANVIERPGGAGGFVAELWAAACDTLESTSREAELSSSLIKCLGFHGTNVSRSRCLLTQFVKRRGPSCKVKFFKLKIHKLHFGSRRLIF